MIHAVSSTVDVEMCLLLELWPFIWAAISEVGNSNELILCCRGNSGSSFPVAVLMRATFILVLDGFCDGISRNFQRSWHFSNWLTFMSYPSCCVCFMLINSVFPVQNGRPIIADYKSIILHIISPNVVLDIFINLSSCENYKFWTSICYLWPVGLIDLSVFE